MTRDERRTAAEQRIAARTQAHGEGHDIELPFPPAALSGHANGGWRAKAALTKQHREWARLAALAAGWRTPGVGDIPILITFYPANKRGDRMNYATRIKAQVDGIADAMKINDRRFLPTYQFAEPVKNPRVVYSLEC